MIKTVANLPFRVLGRAARAVQDRAESLQKIGELEATAASQASELAALAKADTERKAKSKADIEAMTAKSSLAEISIDHPSR